MRLKQRNSEREKVAKHALQSRFIKKYGKEKEKHGNNLANDEKSRKNSNNHSDSTKKGMRNKYSVEESYEGGAVLQLLRIWPLCSRLSKKETRAKDSEEAQYAHARDSDFDDVILMVNT